MEDWNGGCMEKQGKDKYQEKKMTGFRDRLYIHGGA